MQIGYYTIKLSYLWNSYTVFSVTDNKSVFRFSTDLLTKKNFTLVWKLLIGWALKFLLNNAERVCQKLKKFTVEGE